MNQFAKRVVVALAVFLVVVQTVAIAQNLGAAPQVNVAVQGQTGAQPETATASLRNEPPGCGWPHSTVLGRHARSIWSAETECM